VRTLIVSEFISLDGVVEAPGGEQSHPQAGWTMPYGVPDLFAYKLKETLEAESLLLGRTTYEGFSAAWPERDGEFADKMNAMPKFVVSSTLRDADATWHNSTVVRGEVVAGVERLKETVAGDLLVAGSAALVQLLVEHDLADEYRMMVFPIVLGSGKRLFGEVSAPRVLRLDSVQSVGDGIVVLTYRPTAVGSPGR